MYIQASHLSKSYGGQEILKDISFTISDGEKVGLLGRNGSGKTTLFKIVLEQEQPDLGYISISPNNATVGYVPQVSILESDLSAGLKTRQILAQVMRSDPDILFLDEPTNHLDIQALQWLENYIKSFRGTVLLVSHDRRFLDNVVDKVLELEDGHIKAYGSNYSFYKQQKEIEAQTNLRMYVEQQKRIGKLGDRAKVMKNRTQQLEVRTSGADHYVRKKAAKAARSAITIEKRITKELSETSIQKPEPSWSLRALFKSKLESSQTVVQFKFVNKSFGSKQVVKDLSMVIQKGERVALIGPNGSGKTTVIKLITKQLQPDTGEVIIGNNVEIGYLSQEHQELQNNIVIDELTSGSSIDKTEAYKLLRRFLLSPEKIYQPVNSLSSGEKSKLLLAKIMTSGANFIILDEPTNHLDIPSREAIEEAIASYEGTLFVVSHDRYFLERVGITKQVLISNPKWT